MIPNETGWWWLDGAPQHVTLDDNGGDRCYLSDTSYMYVDEIWPSSRWGERCTQAEIDALDEDARNEWLQYCSVIGGP